MNSNAHTEIADDEIDLKELFLSLWAYKFLIAVISALFVFGAAFHALTADKVYTANSTFVLEDNNNAGGLLAGLTNQLGGLAGLAGLPTGGDASNDALIERITAREFVLDLADDLNLREDKYFNDFDPDAVDPLWKATIKTAIGWDNGPRDPQKIADWNVLENFAEFVSVSTTTAGGITVSVEHEIPERAAEIANFIVQKVIDLTNQENLEDVDAKLGYLSKTLADAQEDLERAQEGLKQFSLTNSAQAIQSFAAGSVMLDDLRSQRDQSVDQLTTILALQSALLNSNATQQDYDALRREYPLMDQAGFRRILGLSEIVSAWTWPSLATVTQVQDSVRDRIAALDSEILKLEEDARKYAESAEELAKLTRDAKVAEATYTVLIEQVKSQSLVAGYIPENSKVIAVADVPIRPSKPKRLLVVALGMVLGIFVGSGIALILSLRKGVYFSRGALLEALNAPFSHKISAMRRYRGKSLEDINTALDRSRPEWIRQVILQISDTDPTRPTIIADTTTTMNAAAIARLLGTAAGALNRSVAVIDLSRYAKASDRDMPVENDDLSILDTQNGCTEYVFNRGNQNIEWLFSKTFDRALKQLNSKHELVFLAADFDVLDMVLSAQVSSNADMIAFVRKGKTKSNLIARLARRVNVKVVLHG